MSVCVWGYADNCQGTTHTCAYMYVHVSLLSFELKRTSFGFFLYDVEEKSIILSKVCVCKCTLYNEMTLIVFFTICCSVVSLIVYIYEYVYESEVATAHISHSVFN